MLALWRARSQRERTLILVLVIVVVFVALPAFAWREISAWRVQSRADLAQARTVLDDVSRLAALPRAPETTPAIGPDAVRAAALASAGDLGVALTRVELAPGGGVSVMTASADSVAVWRWLAALGEDHAIVLQRTTLARADGSGTITAELTLVSSAQEPVR
jgi:type II secretory pathway component PulM